jgi:hypothetical protein
MTNMRSYKYGSATPGPDEINGLLGLIDLTANAHYALDQNLLKLGLF